MNITESFRREVHDWIISVDTTGTASGPGFADVCRAVGRVGQDPVRLSEELRCSAAEAQGHLRFYRLVVDGPEGVSAPKYILKFAAGKVRNLLSSAQAGGAILHWLDVRRSELETASGVKANLASFRAGGDVGPRERRSDDYGDRCPSCGVHHRGEC
jgi:hypothetical protein